MRDYLCECGHRYTEHYIEVVDEREDESVTRSAHECEARGCPCRAFTRAAEQISEIVVKAPGKVAYLYD